MTKRLGIIKYLLRVVEVKNKGIKTLFIDVAVVAFLRLLAPCISESCIKMKININFYFHTSLWCLKRFSEACKAFIKPF